MTDQRLFISHANEDADTVDRIVAYLEAHGVPCWIASRDIPPRSIYAEAITQGVKDCAACAVVVSQAANESDAIKRELELASHYRKRFIPIRIDKTEPGPGLDYYLRNTQWIDYGRERERGLDRIVTHMSGATVSAPVRPATSSHIPTPAPPAAQRNGASVGLAIVGALAALAVGWFVLSQGDRSAETEIAEVEAPAVSEVPATAPPANEDTAADPREETTRLVKQRDDAIAEATRGSRGAVREPAPSNSTRDITVGNWRKVSTIANGVNCNRATHVRFQTDSIGFFIWLMSHDNGETYFTTWSGAVEKNLPGRIQTIICSSCFFDYTDTRMKLKWTDADQCEFERSP